METDWPTFQVAQLQEDGCLLVEDGNHGEYRPRPEEFGPGGTAFIRAADMANGRVLFEKADQVNGTALARIRKGVGRGGDVLFSHKGTVGKLALVPLDAPAFVCSPQTTFWRTLDENRLDRRFLYFFMSSRAFREQWHSRKGETDMADYVSLTAQREFRVPVPPMDEQHAIAGILGALDDKIELNRRMNQTLETMAQAVFKSWFVDFDPITAKAAGRQPFGMDPDTASLFPDRFAESSLGPIPEGWRVSRLGGEYQLTMGQSPPGTTYNEEAVGVPFYQGRTDFGFRFPIRRVYCTAPTRYAEPGDTLVSVRAPVGDINMAREASALGRGVAGVRHNCGASSYTYYALRSLADEFAVFDGDGTLFGSIGRDDFEGIGVFAPPTNLVLLFQTRVAPLDRRIETNEEESHTLAAVRDTLLPKLLSGEIRVREAEKVVERAGV